MKHKVKITETLVKVVEVEAENYEEAEKMVEAAYKNSDIILTADDYDSTQFSNDDE